MTCFDGMKGLIYKLVVPMAGDVTCFDGTSCLRGEMN